MKHTSAKLLALVDEAGLSDGTLRQLLSPFGIGPDEFRNVDRLFALDEILAIFRVIVAHVASADTVFRAGQRFRFTDFGIFGLAVMSQPDLRLALRFTMRYRPLSSPMIGLDVHDAEGDSGLVFYPLPGTAEDHDIYPRLLDFNIGMFLSLISDAIGRDDFTSAVQLSARADKLSQDLLRDKGLHVIPDARRDAIVLKPWAMNAPLRHKSTVGAALARKLCGDALASVRNASKFSAEVQAVMIANIEKPLTTAFVARRLGMGERSLRRRLSEENLSFRLLKQSVQSDIARRYLGETRMTIADVALAVGYSDVANFRRAFRALHGVTPQEYREDLRAGGGDNWPNGLK